MAQLPQSVMIRPEQIDNLPRIDAGTKQTYKQGLTQLWSQYHAAPAGTPQRQAIESKIKAASGKLMAMLSGQGNRPGSGGAPRPNPHQPGSGAQAQGAQQVNPGGMASTQAMAQHSQVSGQQVTMASSTLQELQQVTILPPADVPPQEHETWKANWYNSAYELLQKRDGLLAMGRRLQGAVNVAQSRKEQAPAHSQNQLESIKRTLTDLNNQYKSMVMRMQQQSAQRQQPPVNGLQGHSVTQAGSSGIPGPDATSATSDRRPLTNTSPNQPQMGFQQQQQPPPPPPQQPQPPQSGATTQMSQQQSAQRAVTAPTQQKTPQSATQAQPTFPAGNLQQPQRPQINTQQSAQQQQPSQQPGSAVPHSANQAPQRPQALTHQAAVSQAAEHYRTQAQQQPAAAMTNGMPFTTQQSGAGTQQNTPTSAYPNLQNTGHQTSSTTHKFAIPKNLALDPRTQQPASGPASRPTLSNQGMMFNPGVQRPPPYTLEGEGDHVLSKRKLDEMVRQVTGAAPSDKESAPILTPEVEESIMQVADNFVDDVITAACRLAKLRPSATLDIRDIQMVLERNYGIRVPGYSLDEVRTVRKFQPAPGWQSKMQAVQAGKVMGSREG